MSLYNQTSGITITCHKRLAPYLEQEVKELGFNIEETFITGLRLNGTLADCIRLNLNLRTASQVLFSLRQFSAPDADAVYQEALTYPWEDILPEGGYFSVTSNVSNPTINNSLFANLRVKDAVVDRFRERTASRPSTGSELTGAVVHLFWKNEDAELFIDTSGDSLARHGYRKIPGLAPMLEALASATILATRWDRSSPFVNPMCGSGTLAIEAALIATNSRPGLFRMNYAFMHLLGYDEAFYLGERDRLEKQIVDVPGLRIIATDYSPKAIDNARKNAHAAGVAELIEFSVCDFAETEVPTGRGVLSETEVPAGGGGSSTDGVSSAGGGGSSTDGASSAGGVVFMNPEYGERLGEESELAATYGRIGDFMKQRCKGYTGYIFTGNLELAKKIGLKAKRRIEFYTSTIDCRLLEYELYEGTRK